MATTFSNMNVEESPDCIKQGTERKLRRESASIYTFYPHVKYRADSELTEFESNRDERE